jgi:lipopolysaccharide transport system permease protein
VSLPSGARAPPETRGGAAHRGASLLLRLDPEPDPEPDRELDPELDRATTAVAGLPPLPTSDAMLASPPFAILRSVTLRHRELLLELTTREIADRYAGSVLGGLWAVLTPLATMSVYVALFAFVFPARLGVSESPWSGAALILAGLVPWLACVDVATRAPAVFVQQRAIVRQVVFPIEVLPARCALSGIVTWCVGTAIVLAVAAWAVGAKPSWALLPVLWFLQLLAMFGIACLLATLGAWVRDLREIVAILSNIGLYVAPILLLPATLASLPGAARSVIAANPFSHMVWCYHDAVVHGRVEHPASWIVFPAAALLVFVLGTVLFSRARHGIAEVL